MKCLFYFLLILSGLSITLSSQAQDTLPKFTVRNAGNNRIIIGWVNPFPNLTQISIQRSFDSLKNYKTILTVADPKALQNGFADTKAPNDRMFYRIFYVAEGGNFFFTQPQRPDTSRPTAPVIGDKGPSPKPRADTLTGKKGVEVKKPDWTPSFFVYTNKDGYVFINLPDAEDEKYSIKFFEADNTPLFELKSVRQKGLTLDKANFMHAGWFFFELYNGDKLVERNKFFLSKDF